MATNPSTNPSPLRLDWTGLAASLLTPTVVTTLVGAVAAIVVGARHTFGAPVDQDMVYMGLGALLGVAVTRRTG